MLVGGFLDQFTVAIEQQLVDLRALAAPEGDEELLASFYDEVEAVLGAIIDHYDNSISFLARQMVTLCLQRLDSKYLDMVPANRTVRI